MWRAFLQTAKWLLTEIICMRKAQIYTLIESILQVAHTSTVSPYKRCAKMATRFGLTSEIYIYTAVSLLVQMIFRSNQMIFIHRLVNPITRQCCRYQVTPTSLIWTINSAVPRKLPFNSMLKSWTACCNNITKGSWTYTKTNCQSSVIRPKKTSCVMH